MVYRWLLRLYPYNFRRQYQEELEADFESARLEARADGRSALLACYRQAALDLAVSVPREWLRTPWLAAVAGAALIASGLFYYVVVRVYRAGSFPNSSNEPPESPELIWLMAAMVLVPVIAMLLIGVAARLASAAHAHRRRRV